MCDLLIAKDPVVKDFFQFRFVVQIWHLSSYFFAGCDDVVAKESQKKTLHKEMKNVFFVQNLSRPESHLLNTSCSINVRNSRTFRE